MTYALHVETSAPRPGRRFEPVRERELHGDALRAVEALPGAARGLVVVPEFAGPVGVPDFTAYVGPTSALGQRQMLGVAPVLNEIDAGILSAVHVRRPVTLGEIAATLQWPVGTLRRRIRPLVLAGALVEHRQGFFVRPPEIAASGRLYAIEAKVEDWRKALRQVRTYRSWADAYVLVMTGLSERSTQALLHEVERDRGGLVVDGLWLARPRLGPTLERRRLQAAERFAAVTEHGLRNPALALAVHS